MGQVFRARDTRLNRDVAVKVLPDSFAGDRDRLARFDREAQVLASFSHPNIAHVYGVEEAGSTRAIVMELVGGATLAERVAAGPMPLDEVLPIARQIVDALEAAHEQTIVHRDLKPANIKVRDDGLVKVLDFGLAKALDPTPAPGSQAANSPTFTAIGTHVGVILGTAAYMSPEQAKGKAVDKRADVWAFGVVLYEMLTGRPLFPGENVSETLAHVILKDPDWSALPPATPRAIRDLLRRCLVRDPRNRLRDIGEARIALDGAAPDPATPEVPVATPRVSHRREWILGAVALVFLLTTIAAVVGGARTPAPPSPRMIFDVLPSPSEGESGFNRRIALSPDGRHLAFSTVAPSRAIYLRSLDTTLLRALPGTEFVSQAAPALFWSADSAHIAFFADGRLKRVPVSGGSPHVIATLPPAQRYSGTWSQDGVILFSAYGSGPFGVETSTIWRVAATGGQPTPLVDPKTPGSEFLGYPEFLPDGRHYLALTGGPNSQDQAFVGQLDSTERRPLPGIGSPARYASAGYLLFMNNEGGLLAQRFDPAELQLSGDVIPVADDVIGTQF